GGARRRPERDKRRRHRRCRAPSRRARTARGHDALPSASSPSPRSAPSPPPGSPVSWLGFLSRGCVVQIEVTLAAAPILDAKSILLKRLCPAVVIGGKAFIAKKAGSAPAFVAGILVVA